MPQIGRYPGQLLDYRWAQLWHEPSWINLRRFGRAWLYLFGIGDGR